MAVQSALAGVAPTEVEQNVRSILVAALLQAPGCQQGGLAGTRLPEDHQRRTIDASVAIENTEIVLPADIDSAEPFRQCFVFVGLAIQRVGQAVFGKPLIDDGSEVGANQRGQSMWVGVVLANRKPAQANSLLQLSEPVERFGILRAVSITLCGRQRFNVAGIAEVEEGMFCHIGAVQRAVQNLQFGYGLVLMSFQPRFPLDEVVWKPARNPAIPFSLYADEKGAAAVNLLQTNRQHAALGLLFVGDSPAQIDFAPDHPTLGAQMPQLGKDSLHQLLPFRRACPGTWRRRIRE